MTLWTEKYRPGTLNGYVFRDESQQAQVQKWINDQSIPHLLFSGSPGVGKTTLAKILINALDVNDHDVLEINASRENSVDAVKNKITTFVSTMPFGDFKVVLLDEADYMSPNGQAALRGVMETYHESAKFILTCNYPHKIINALHSRCQGFHIAKIDKTEFTARLAEILITEQIDFDIDILDSFVRASYPDLRKAINLCQQSVVDNQLKRTEESGSTADWRIAAVDLFKARKITEGRKLICSQANPDEMDGTYRWMYDNLDLWGDTEEQQDQAILIIAKGLRNVPLVADQEINLSATLVELANI